MQTIYDSERQPVAPTPVLADDDRHQDQRSHGQLSLVIKDKNSPPASHRGSPVKQGNSGWCATRVP